MNGIINIKMAIPFVFVRLLFCKRVVNYRLAIFIMNAIIDINIKTFIGNICIKPMINVHMIFANSIILSFSLPLFFSFLSDSIIT